MTNFNKICVKNVKFGLDVEVFEPSNMYNCTLGNGVLVGPFCEIQSNVDVGDRTRIQSHSFICEGVEIGADCFIGHGVMFINDTFSIGGPANGNKSLWKVTKVGDQVSIGSNATILPVEICDGTIIGAGAVVTKDIKIPGKYIGNPARRLKNED